MPLVVPNAVEVIILQGFLNTPLTIRLFGTNVVPGPASVVGNFTEIAGGGYANKPLLFANWVFAAGGPSTATYPVQTWNFTGVVNAPGTVYGYYVTRNSDGILLWASQFTVVPFIPVNGSILQITPLFTADSVF